MFNGCLLLMICIMGVHHRRVLCYLHSLGFQSFDSGEVGKPQLTEYGLDQAVEICVP
jgi:hypothetical protein